MSDYLREIISGTWSLFVGLGITIRYFFQPVVTVQYPHQTLPMTPRFRGHTELVADPESGGPLCIVCGMCEKACPSNCITVRGEKREGVKGKVLTEYTLDFTRCSLCGLCVESCPVTPTKAITFSRDYNLAGVSKEAYIFDLKAELSSSPAQTKLMPPGRKAELSSLPAQTKLMPFGCNKRLEAKNR